MSKMFLLFFLVCLSVTQTLTYSARRDALVIAEYRRGMGLNHAKIARELVHRANWASVATISTSEAVKDYPMVNVISIDDNNANNVSTGVIRYLLTDLDFTGTDWHANNKVTFLFTDEQNLNCKNSGKDPMEPTCARVMISGQVKKLDEKSPDYISQVDIFTTRHPAASSWTKTHHFYLCELNIQNIYVLDFYGGPHQVTPSEYYAINI